MCACIISLSFLKYINMNSSLCLQGWLSHYSGWMQWAPSQPRQDKVALGTWAFWWQGFFTTSPEFGGTAPGRPSEKSRGPWLRWEPFSSQSEILEEPSIHTSWLLEDQKPDCHFSTIGFSCLFRNDAGLPREGFPDDGEGWGGSSGSNWVLSWTLFAIQKVVLHCICCSLFWSVENTVVLFWPAWINYNQLLFSSISLINRETNHISRRIQVQTVLNYENTHWQMSAS